MVAFEVVEVVVELLPELSLSIGIVWEKPFSSSKSFLLGFGFGGTERGIESFSGRWIEDFILDGDVEQKELESKDESFNEAMIVLLDLMLWI